MSQFKVGQKVRVVNKGRGRCNLDTGIIVTVREGRYPDRDGDYACNLLDGSNWNYVNESNLEALSKTLDNLEVGDTILTAAGCEFKVLAVLPGLYALSELRDTQDHFDDWQTPAQMISKGYTVKGAKPEDDTVEVTLEEVAKLKGISVDKLRIKE